MMMKKTLIFCLLLSLIACDDIIEVVDISNKTITILAPTNDVILKTNEIAFTWEALEESETYQIQIATPNFVNATQIIVDSTLTKTSIIKTLPANSYEWRVRAENSGYKTNYTRQSFTIEE